MQDDWGLVQRQPDTFPSVPKPSTSQGPGRAGTCGSFGMRLHWNGPAHDDQASP